MFGKSRHRIRGKPFKLFSDELPNFEYGDTNDVDPFKETEEPQRSRGRKKRMQSFNDRLSLPSLGTPDKDDASFTMSDSRISSGQSNPNILSPDLAELHNRIRARHGLKDNVSKGPPRGLPRRSTTLKMGPSDRPTVFKRDNLMGQEKGDTKRKGGTIETHFDRYENAFTEEFGKIQQTTIQRDDSSLKSKSILQQLLDASARDFSKRKQINDGLIPNPGESLHRNLSVRIPSSDTKRRENVPPPQDKSQEQVKSDFKPGILKRETNKDRHSIRVPKMSPPHGHSPKPRLIHHEQIDGYEEYPPRYATSPGGVVSVHYDVPRNKVNDMLLLPQKKTKQKRVYFKDNDEFLDIPSHDDGEVSRSRGFGRKPSRRRKASPYPSDEIEIKAESYLNMTDNEISSTRRNRDSFEITRSQSLKPIGQRESRRGRSSPYPKEVIQRHNERNPDVGTNDELTSRTTYQEDGSHRDTFSEDMFYTDDQSSVFSTPSPRKELQFSGFDRDQKTDTSRWKGSKPPLPPLQPAFFDQLKSETVTPGRTESPKSTRLRRTESERVGKPLNIPALVLPSNNDIHINEQFTGSRNPEAIGLDELPDDFDLSELPEDIDRSLDGVELIKAYRLWDRERKAFPSGLRKIDIPFDPRDFILSKLKNANAKSQRTTNQKTEVKATLV